MSPPRFRIWHLALIVAVVAVGLTALERMRRRPIVPSRAYLSTGLRVEAASPRPGAIVVNSTAWVNCPFYSTNARLAITATRLDDRGGGEPAWAATIIKTRTRIPRDKITRIDLTDFPIPFQFAPGQYLVLVEVIEGVKEVRPDGSVVPHRSAASSDYVWVR